MTVSPELLTVPEAAKVANVSARTMRRWVTSGHVRTVGSGHRRRVVATSLQEPVATADTLGQEERSSDGTVSATADTKTDTVVNAVTADIEAGHLAALVRDLTDRLTEQTALTAVWMERARVLGDQIALAAPQSSPAASTAAESTPAPFLKPSTPRWRALVPWLLALVVLAGVAALLAWPW